MEQITALLLCGGSGRRVGGADKALLSWRGQPLVEHVFARIQAQTMRAQVKEVLVSANRNLAAYARLAPTITDAPLASNGPLTGILRGLQEADTDWLWVCPGDAPLLAPQLMQRLWDGRTASSQLVTAHDGRRDQWLHMLVHAHLQDSLTLYLNKGGESVHGWAASLPIDAHTRADCADISESFFNVNTLEQLMD